MGFRESWDCIWGACKSPQKGLCLGGGGWVSTKASIGVPFGEQATWAYDFVWSVPCSMGLKAPWRTCFCGWGSPGRDSTLAGGNILRAVPPVSDHGPRHPPAPAVGENRPIAAKG